MGLFEEAMGGTVFLDEIGEMSPTMQPKLLRVLQEGEVTAVGDTRPRKVDIRLISATNRDLAADVAVNRFRQDLYYRVAGFPIRLPPLRERREDISLLVQRALAQVCARNRRRIPEIEPAAMELLTRFDWPGNVRELQNELERIVAVTRDREAIGPVHLSLRVRGSVSPPVPAPAPNGASVPVSGGARTETSLRDGRAAYEAEQIAGALRKYSGNISQAAQALGLSRVTLYKKIKDYGLR
jgi:two-component system, NtrC family, response regulator HupR/HoxA